MRKRLARGLRLLAHRLDSRGTWLAYAPDPHNAEWTVVTTVPDHPLRIEPFVAVWGPNTNGAAQ